MASELTDADVALALGLVRRDRQYSVGLTYGKDWDRYTAYEWFDGEEVVYTGQKPPPFTTSLDDCAAECERRGWKWSKLHLETFGRDPVFEVYRPELENIFHGATFASALAAAAKGGE